VGSEKPNYLKIARMKRKRLKRKIKINT